ncbi:MAG: antibiotic biosynthesis monooxygenase [Candidatus Promineofilum sp.]|nr:antibiotic biosynthesis monooxygenase [Promineifilum sp.]
MHGLIGKMIATPGARDELIAILLESIAGMPGNLSYIVARDPADEDAIWITEVWDNAESHGASLSLPAVREAISRARPLIAGFGDQTVTTPAGGSGLGAAAGGIANRSMPPGAIIPELAYDDVDAAAAWLCATFGFRERLRIGHHRRQLVYDGESLIVTQATEGPAQRDERHSVMVRVPDVDAHYAHVKQAGVPVLGQPQTHAFGERQYSVEDVGGHVWTFSQSVADIDPQEWGGQLIAP